MEHYFKYKSLTNLRYIIDIISNNKLYAANYKELNDPMEGAYITNSNNRSLIHVVGKEKNKIRILSLTKNNNHMLMWSHYADSHKGCCFEVSLKPNSTLPISKIEYIDKVQSISNGEAAIDLLSKKLDLWQYENEYRVFTKANHVQVIVHSVVFGLKVTATDINFHIKWMRAINPNLKFYKCIKSGDASYDIHIDEVNT